jgi:predicted methyltransferase
MIMPKPLLLALALATGVGGAGLAQDAPPAYVAAAVAAADRPKEDSDRDALRKPAAMVVFAGIKPGDKVADIMPGGGYFTRIFSRIVGPKGHVYAVIPTELAQASPTAADAPNALAANPAYGNISVVLGPTAALSAPAPLDVAWTSQNYHDLYGFFGADKAAAFDAAVFKMLKPGGVFIVIDHAAAAGTPDASVKVLHRIDEAVVKAQVQAAGFRLESESNLLANPADTHAQPVFAPAIRGRTDQFVLKFRKP